MLFIAALGVVHGLQRLEVPWPCSVTLAFGAFAFAAPISSAAPLTQQPTFVAPEDWLL